LRQPRAWCAMGLWRRCRPARRVAGPRRGNMLCAPCVGMAGTMVMRQA
jgi:hypothetical protein